LHPVTSVSFCIPKSGKVNFLGKDGRILPSPFDLRHLAQTAPGHFEILALTLFQNKVFPGILRAMAVADHIRKKLSVLPHKPGIYLHKDRFGTVIYVGKAHDARKRVSGISLVRAHYRVLFWLAVVDIAGLWYHKRTVSLRKQSGLGSLCFWFVPGWRQQVTCG